MQSTRWVQFKDQVADVLAWSVLNKVLFNSISVIITEGINVLYSRDLYYVNHQSVTPRDLHYKAVWLLFLLDMRLDLAPRPRLWWHILTIILTTNICLYEF